VNLPNKLTVSRILLAFLLMGLVFVPGVYPKACALFVFVLACFTDYLDGWLARRHGLVTDFGKIMDPLADKVLNLGVFLSFVELQLVASWMVVVIIIRESLITGMRLVAMRRGLVLAAEDAGKHKTVSQMVTIFFILVFLVVKEAGLRLSFWGAELEQAFRRGIWALMATAVALTIISGSSFVWKNRRIIRNL